MSQVYCSSCGTASESGASFCGNCGKALAAQQTAQQTIQQAAGQTAAGYQAHTGYASPGGAPVGPGQGPHGYGVPGAPGQIPGYGGYVSPEVAAALEAARAEGVQLPAGTVPAGFWVRLGAYLIDGVILGIVTYALGISNNLLTTLLLGAYSIAFWVLRGQTPGKMALGLTVVSSDGSPLDAKKAAIRFGGYAVSALILCIGFIMIGLGGAKRGLHDRIAGTLVVRKIARG